MISEPCLHLFSVVPVAIFTLHEHWTAGDTLYLFSSLSSPRARTTLLHSHHHVTTVDVSSFHLWLSRCFPHQKTEYDPRCGFSITQVTMRKNDGIYVCEATYQNRTEDRILTLEVDGMLTVIQLWPELFFFDNFLCYLSLSLLVAGCGSCLILGFLC